jgi:tripartite-type tricarboxylate transporter receptor subunit TctC
LYAVLAPAGTPAAIVGRLSNELAKIVGVRDIRDRLQGLGLETVGGAPEQLTEFMRADLVKWSKLVQSIGLKTD